MNKVISTDQSFNEVNFDTIEDLNKILLKIEDIEKSFVLSDGIDEEEIKEEVRSTFPNRVNLIQKFNPEKYIKLNKKGWYAKKVTYSISDQQKVADKLYKGELLSILKNTVEHMIYEKKCGNINLEKNKDIANEFIKNVSEVLLGNVLNNDSFYIREKSNEYYFNNTPVYIKNKNAQYVIIFDVTYHIQPNGGKIKYEDIIKICNKKGLKNLTKKSIQGALTGKDAKFFKYVKKIPQDIPFGKSLFVAMQNGKELEFNNKK